MTSVKTKLAFGMLILGLCAVMGWILSQREETPVPLAEGAAIPEWNFVNRQNQTLSFRQLRGQVLLINFWATWCPPCLEELPSLNALMQTLKGKPVRLLAFSADSSWDPVDKIIQSKSYDIEVFPDFKRQLALQFGTFKYPETYLVDKQGILRMKVTGATNWMAPEMQNFLQRLASE